MSSNQRLSFLPVLCLLLTASLWGIIWYPLRLMEARGLQGLWSLVLMYGVAMSVGMTIIIIRRYPVQQYWLLLILALVNGWCNTAFVIAVIDGNVVRVLLLFYLSPLWTVILSKFMLNEPISRSSKITLSFAMIGALIMLWNPDFGMPWPQTKADWLALSSGFTFALSNVLVRRMHEIPVWIKTSSTWAGVTFIAGVWILIAGHAVPVVAYETVVMAMLLGIMIVVMTLALVYGVTHMPAHQSAIILLFELVVGAVSAQLLTDELVMPNEWVGGVLIVMAAWFAARSHAKEIH